MKSLSQEVAELIAAGELNIMSEVLEQEDILNDIIGDYIKIGRRTTNTFEIRIHQTQDTIYNCLYRLDFIRDEECYVPRQITIGTYGEIVKAYRENSATLLKAA